jgi:hypothetical protein
MMIIMAGPPWHPGAAASESGGSFESLESFESIGLGVTSSPSRATDRAAARDVPDSESGVGGSTHHESSASHSGRG